MPGALGFQTREWGGGGEDIGHLHRCGSHRGSQLLPRGAKRREGARHGAEQGSMHRCPGCTVPKAQEGLCLPKVVL